MIEENKIKSITSYENNNWTQERWDSKEERRLFYRESSLLPERNDILQKLLQMLTEEFEIDIGSCLRCVKLPVT